MRIKKLVLFFLLLTFLAGEFSLGRLNLGFDIEIRYVLFFAFGLTLLIGLNIKHHSIIGKNELNFITVFFIYTLFSTASLFWTPDQSLALDKYIYLLFLGILIIGSFLTVEFIKPKEFYAITSSFFISIGVVYAIPIFMSVISGASRGDVLLSGPNVTTRILFFAACSSFYKYCLNKSFFYILINILFLASIVLVGSRGGLVGAVSALLVMFFVRKPINFWKIKRLHITFRKLVLFSLIMGAFMLVYNPVKKVFIERIIGVTFDNSGGLYTSGRGSIYSNAIEMIKEKPVFGYGIDSFTPTTGHVYPHNLLLEMMVEVGLIGALVFLAFLAYSIFFIFKLKDSPLFVFSILPLYMIIVQMFSGEFYDFRYYFLWSVPILHYGAVHRSELLYASNFFEKKKQKNRKKAL